MNKPVLLGIIFSILLLTQALGQESNDTDSVHYFTIDTSAYILRAVSINTPNSEFSPVLKNGDMVFVSDRINPVSLGYTPPGERQMTEIYTCEQVDTVRFKSEKPFSKTINTPFDDGPLCFSDDKKLVIYSSNSPHRFSLKQEDSARMSLQLFQSVLSKKGWMQPTKLPFCKNEFSYTHPFLSKDGSTLFFSSDMKGGKGGMDLYYSRWDEGVWSAPVNLGPEINSPYNEVFPFLSAENVLYFSSSMPNGYGGLDLYSFSMQDSAHSKKQLLEPPLNSGFDDFGVSTDAGMSGYFSSNRSGKGKDDIYYFRSKYPKSKNCSPYKAPSYCYTFYEESTGDNLSDNGVQLTYEWNLGDGSKVKGLEARHCFSTPGVYNVELNIVEEASGALFYNETSYEFTVEDAEQVYLNCPDTIIVAQPVYVSSEKSRVPGSSILSYLWDFGNGDHSSGIAGLYRYNKEGVYPIRLQVGYRNDSSGHSDKICLERNIVVMNSSWKESDNNTYASSQKKKTTYSTENVDSLNFRVFLGTSETRIPKDANFFEGLTDVKESLKDSLFIYTAGSKSKALDLTGEYAKAKANGFSSARVLAYGGDSLISNIDNLLNVRIYDGIIDLKKNNTILKEFSSNIYFDAFVDSIQVKYLPTLDFVAEMLKKQPELTISIYSFTDTIGLSEFSEDVFEQARLSISVKRGEAIKKYLEKKRLKIPEIKNIPKGEHIPQPGTEMGTMNTNALYNRRVTIYVKKK
ncbi:MAG: PKD domain-containing protein [Bacteroidia bacterium]